MNVQKIWRLGGWVLHVYVGSEGGGRSGREGDGLLESQAPLGHVWWVEHVCVHCTWSVVLPRSYLTLP